MGKLLQLVSHPTELRAALQFKFFKESAHPLELSRESDSLKNCYAYLKITSRSFASVIKELHPELRNAIMIFYLVLRALDTIEDDMTIDPKIKVPLLRSFHEKLNLKDWTFDGNAPTEKDRIVLVRFDQILTEYHKLKPAYQDIVKDITKKMGNGMADYILDDNFNANGVATVKDFDLYCHYVAGLVGEGCSKLMVLARFADSQATANNFELSESMGLFLQKTNIIRDYHEDLEDGRSFYPKEIWSKYTDQLYNFHNKPEETKLGVECISELVLNALGHVKDVLTYLALIKEPTSFNFCAIPQVMAIATLAEIYNNPSVLHSNVKIRKGTTVQLILKSRTLPGVVEIFRHYIRVINQKSNVRDRNYLKIGIKLGEIEQMCDTMYPPKGSRPAHVGRSTHKINDIIEQRGSFDTDGAQVIAIENLKCNVALILATLAFFSVGYAIFQAWKFS